MSPMLLGAILTITFALAFYTVGVWGEKLQKTLKIWHVILFWFGFAFDATGTTLMSRLAQGAASGNLFHSMTGIAAIVLMLFHAIWATIVSVRKDDKQKKNFHKLSLVVWIIWLIPFLSGMIMGMRG